MKCRTGILSIAFVAAFAPPPLAQAAKKPVSNTKSAAMQAPRFEVAMLWPKPMGDHWILGGVTGLAVDAKDHVFVLNTAEYFNARTEIGTVSPTAYGECCAPAPAVLELDAAGNVVAHWGGPGDGYDWPASPSGLAIDPKGNIWIGGAGPADTRVLVFSHDGKFLMQVGKAVAAPVAAAPAAPPPDTAYAGVSGGGRAAAGRGGRGGGRGRGRGGPPPLPANSSSMESFGGATSISFDAAANEAFIADGSRNHRVVVVDMTTGAFKRFWGAYGEKPDDAAAGPYDPSATPSRQFGTPVLCAERAKDGLVYVCDSRNDRVQVFKSSGEFVKEKILAPATRALGSVWDVAFSRDPKQKYLYVADGANMKVRILDRESLDELTAFGDGGRVPGEFYGLRTIATDSKGNIYTGETFEGKRVQEFTYKGVGAVTSANRGVLWPAASKAGRGGDR